MDSMTAWLFLTRWGNAVLMLPVAACICIGLWAGGDRRTAWRWALAFGPAVLLVLASKLAFLGWGIGIRALDFTGISGHTTLASSVLPMLAWWLTRDRSEGTRTRAIVAAMALAVVVAISRLLLQTHSIAEVVAGLALGSFVAWLAIPGGRSVRVGHAFGWLVLGALLVAGTIPGPGDSGEAHGVVVRLALLLSGHSEPFTRTSMR